VLVRSAPFWFASVLGGAGIRFNYTPEGTQVCFEVGLGIGGGIEVDPQGQLDHDGAYIKGEAEASIGPFGGKIEGRLLDCGEMEGEADCKFGPLYCSGKAKPVNPEWAERDFKGVKAGAKVASNFCMTMRY